MLRYNNYHKHDHVSNIFTPDCNVKAEDYIKKCVEYGHTNYFTTNHGSFGDIFEARTLCNQYGLRCIAGIEGYIVPNPLEKDKSNYHIIIIPKTDEARKKMNYVSSRANIEGYYYKPRIFIEDLLKLDKNDIFITTACVQGILKDENSYKNIFLPLYNYFGNNMMLEIQSHLDPLQININQRIKKLHDKLGLKIIAANDSHYIDVEGQKERLELLKGKHIEYGAEDSFILDFPTAETMMDRFKEQGVFSESEIKEAINNTLLFDECEEIKLDYSIKMPTIYPELTPKERVELLKKKIIKRFNEIRKEEHIQGEELEKYKEGIRYEMKIIEDTNEEIHTADYFLFNEKNVDLAVNKYGGILTRGGRGSCGSFYINRILGMTQLDRFKINLPLFPDRFASTARLLENRAIPDIDYNVMKQEPFVEASKELLGENGCYPMYAPGTMQLAEAFRNVCRSKGMEYDSFNEVAKDLENHLEDPDWIDIIKEANKYVGTIVSGSVHPCAHLLSSENILYEYGVTRLGENVCVLITSSEADEYKVLKNDYLIVKVWKLIAETFDLVGIPIISARELLESIKDDERIWDLFKYGITCTLNQVDSDNGTQQAKKYGIHSFIEGAYIAAAIRPSFDSWRDKFLTHSVYSTGSKQLDEVLSSTNGYILYQENLMQYFEWLGVTPAESIGLIKKISKKKIKPEDFNKLEERIKKKWIENTGSEDMFQETWNMIQSCMAYGFCVSGDTVLKRNGNGNKHAFTIEEMYKIRNSRKYAAETNHIQLYTKYRTYGYGKALSLYDDGYVYENDIKDIYYMGTRDVYLITTKSKRKIKCTLEHKFPTPNGIKQLSELTIGDELYVLGEYQKRNKSYRLTKTFEPNTPKSGEQGFQSRPDGQSVIFESERLRHFKNKDCCENCGEQYNSNFELHHKDLDRTNNSPENLQWLCNSCHKKIHYINNRNKRYERGLTTNTDSIISIEKLDREDIYSVEMADPAHNYTIDNGIITCNCSAHAAATSLDMCYGAYLKVNYPLEYYTVCLNNYADDITRTNKLIKELDYFNIKLKGIKFRHSKAEYSLDKKHKIIYKGLTSIKYMNDKVANELYDLRDKQYDSFMNLLVDIGQTSCDSRQLGILIDLGFFDEFGHPNQLNKQVEMFNKFYGRKQIKKDSIEGYPEWVFEKHCDKSSDKMYKFSDTLPMLIELCSTVDYPKTTIKNRIQSELEHLGYIQTTLENISDEYYYVNEINGNWLTLYQLHTGNTIKIKSRKKYLQDTDIDVNKIIKIIEIKDEQKWRKDAMGEWYRDDETEPILTRFLVLK